MGEMADYYVDRMIDYHLNYNESYIPERKTIGSYFPNLEKETKMLERDIERKSVEHAKKHGWITYKFTSPQRRSVPDRIFISPTGIVFFIEFKQKGKKPTKGQDREIEKLCKQGCNVFVFDDVEHTKLLVSLFTEESDVKRK